MTEKPARVAKSAALTNTTTASDCQCQAPSGQISGNEPEQGKDGYGGNPEKTARKGGLCPRKY